MSGRGVLVTGSSRGVGAATALAFAARGCSGYTTRNLCCSARSFILVPAAKSAAFWDPPCNMTISGTAVPSYTDGTYTSKVR